METLKWFTVYNQKSTFFKKKLLKCHIQIVQNYGYG